MMINQLYFVIRKWLLIDWLTQLFTKKLTPFIICYHSINTEEVESHILYLKKYFTIKHVSELTYSDRGCCAITLDDCVKNHTDALVQICNKFNIPVTLYLPVKACLDNDSLYYDKILYLIKNRDFIIYRGKKLLTKTKDEQVNAMNYVTLDTYTSGIKISDLEIEFNNCAKQNQFEPSQIPLGLRVISKDEVQELSKNINISIQSHSMTHPIFNLCNEMEIEYELIESQKIISALTNKPVTSFCYPFGSEALVGKLVRSKSKEIYNNAVMFTLGLLKKGDTYEMSRIGIYPGDDLHKFTSKIYHHQNIRALKHYTHGQ
jgi:peptidoglycan/xylan/chitin deacetylase (PgdA/CDA1 family)